MSFFARGFWIPSGVTFGSKLLNTGLNLYDSLISTLICTLFSGIQLCMCRNIIRLHTRLSAKQGRSRKQHMQTLLLTLASVVFAAMFILSALIYCIQFSRNVLVLRTTTSLPGASRKFDSSWLECIGGDVNRCIEVPMENLYTGRRMELGYAALVQILIFLTDVLLVARCYFIYSDIPYVWWSAAVSLVASLGVTLFGLASLAKAGGLSGGSSWHWSISDAASKLPRGYNPSMSIISSLFVNIIVTVSIVTRMLLTRRKLMRTSLAVTHGQAGRRDDVYFTATALLIESALPPAVFGVLAAIFASPSVQASRKAFEFELIPRVAWVAFTALAPQLLLVRILQGRAWGSGHTSTGGTTMAMSASSRFSRATTAPMTFSKGQSIVTNETIDDSTQRRVSLHDSESMAKPRGL